MDQKITSPMVMTPTSAVTIEDLTRDFRRLQAQKARKTGGVEGRVLENLAFVSQQQYVGFRDGQLFNEPRDPNKLYLMFDLIGPRLNKLLGRLSSIAPTYKARPNKTDPKSIEVAEIVDRLIIALDDKLVQPSRTWELLWWLAVGGVAFEHTPWVPNASVEPMAQFTPTGELLYRHLMTGEEVPESAIAGQPPEMFEILEKAVPVGDVGSEILGPLNVFVDQSVSSISEMAPDQRVYIAKIKTVGWIEDTFNVKIEPSKNLSIINSTFSNNMDMGGSGGYLKDLIPIVQGSQDKDDPGMAIVVEGYSPPSQKEPRGRYECFVPNQQIIHSEASPYGSGIPITDFHWKPVTTTFWTPGYIEALIPPQRFINKRISQLGEQSNSTLYSNLLLGGSLTKDDIPADYPGTVKGGLDENGTPLVQRMAPPELPMWFMDSLDNVIKMFNDIAGGSDLFEEHKFPGQMRGPMAVPLMQEILDTEWGPLYLHLGERMSRVKQMRLDRVKEFYPPVRTLHYTDRNQKDEVIQFHTDEVLRRGVNFNVTVERGELIPELRALREARLTERLSGPLSILYLDERTGRLDKSKIAADLKFGDAGREGREAQYRKLGKEIASMLWKLEQVPPVLPFYDHKSMMDELEAEMATTEYLRASPQVQQIFSQRWEQHRQFLMMEAQAQQQAMMSGQMHSAVAQATQQAAAMTAAETVHQTMQQVGAQREQPTGQLVRAAVSRGQPAPGGNKPPNGRPAPRPA